MFYTMYLQCKKRNVFHAQVINVNNCIYLLNKNISLPSSYVALTLFRYLLRYKSQNEKLSFASLGSHDPLVVSMMMIMNFLLCTVENSTF